MLPLTERLFILRTINALFDSAEKLLVDSDIQQRTQPVLRSGLYIVTTPEKTRGSHQIFVLYWPEETTWDDSAPSSVGRNRTAFMRSVHINSEMLGPEPIPLRYLTKMCDQIVALISSEHAQSILWSDKDDENEEDINMLDMSQDASDRMFSFEVAQTNEQEESVTVREGFKVSSLCTPASSCLATLTYGTTISGHFTYDYTSRSTY